MEYEPVLKSSFRGSYKKRSILFGNNDAKRVLRAHKMSTDRRDRRNKDFESRRDLSEEIISPHLTPTLEEIDEPAQVAVPVVDAIDRRRLALQKWKEEKEQKKIIMNQLKKPIFKTGVVQHRIYSPAPPSKPHNHAGSKVGKQRSLAPKNHKFNFKAAKITVATSPVALKRSYQARSKAEDRLQEDIATRVLGRVTRARAKQIAQVQKVAFLTPVNNMAKIKKLPEENVMLDSLPLKILPQRAGGKGDSRNLMLVPSARGEGKAPPFVTMTASAYEAKTPGASCFKRNLQTPAKVTGKTPANKQGKTPAQTPTDKVIGKTPANTQRKTPAQIPANKVIGNTLANTQRKTPAQTPANKVIVKTPANKVIGKTPAQTATNTRGQKTVQIITSTLLKTPACTNSKRNTPDQNSIQTGKAIKSMGLMMDTRRSLEMEFDNAAVDEENKHETINEYNTNTIDEMDAAKSTVTSSTEDKDEDKTLESVGDEDTKNSLRDGVYPAQGSPFVTTTRGRCGSASYTRARASSINKMLSLTVCLSEPFAPSKEIPSSSSELNVKHFRDTLVIERNTLIAKCEYWQAIQSTDAEIPLKVHELVDSAVGQTRLLVTKKFVQFEGLMDMCETGQGRRVTLEDLQGFWEMVYMQVGDVNHRFSQLELLRANSWHEESPVKKVTRQRAQNKKGVNKTKGNAKSSIKNLILAARKKKKEDCASNDWTDENTLAVNVLDFQHSLPTIAAQPLDKTSVLPVSPENSDQVKQPLSAINVNTPPRKSILKPGGHKTGDYTQRRRSARINVKFIDIDSNSENDSKCEFPLTPHVRSRSRMSSMLPGLNSTSFPGMALPSGDLISLDSPVEAQCILRVGVENSLVEQVATLVAVEDQRGELWDEPEATDLK
uniref:Disks large-associated protein 5 n=1 Tax=Timema genevievae TaxID=629358 RepID=A0A7R9JP87_TIMGE|nr:unnamed protein product [Timema genevievae]